uniref:Uncharacterized protein n=1 Tax=candidate division WOR-3 bacterium TaxID=2052148 RepID=A0A7C4CC91_UNCW3
MIQVSRGRADVKRRGVGGVSQSRVAGPEPDEVIQAGRRVLPVNPSAGRHEGLFCRRGIRPQAVPGVVGMSMTEFSTGVAGAGTDVVTGGARTGAARRG